MKLPALIITIALKRREILAVIVHDDLIDNRVLNLRGFLGTLEDQEDEGLQEVLLLAEILSVLNLGDLERVHRDRMLLGIADVRTAEIAADTLVGVTGINDDNVSVLLVVLTYNGIHEEGLTAARRTQHEEIRVVGVFDLSLLTGDIHGKGNTLAVGIVTLQRRVLRLGLALLIHQTQGRVTQREEAVVVRRETVAVAGEAGHEKLQLVIGPLGDMDALTGEDVLQMVRDLLHVLIGIYGDDQVIMRINQLLGLLGNDILHLLDILGSKGVAGIGHGSMAVTLLVEHGQLTLLVGQEQYLVEDNTVRIGNAVNLTHQVDRHHTIVDGHVNIGTQGSGEADGVHIQQTVDLRRATAHMNLLTVNLEIGHADNLRREILGEETVSILTAGIGIQEGGSDTAVLQLVIDLTDLDREIAPLRGIIAQKGTLLTLLCDDKIGAAVSVRTSVHETEIAVRKEQTAGVSIGVTTGRDLLHIEMLAGEDVLLMQGIALTKRLENTGHQSGKRIIALHVGRVLLNRILHTEDG